jgi:hypothetical protein
MVRKTQELRAVMTRIPEGLRRRLERQAELNRRSMNAEIIHRLETSFRRQDYALRIAQAMKAYRQTLAELGVEASEAVQEREKGFEAGIRMFIEALTKPLKAEQPVTIKIKKNLDLPRHFLTGRPEEPEKADQDTREQPPIDKEEGSK